MSSVTPETRTLFQRLLFRDTLTELFRCADCGACLVGHIGLGRVRDGQLIDVPCPHCKEVWTFTRTLSKLCPKQEISHV